MYANMECSLFKNGYYVGFIKGCKRAIAYVKDKCGEDDVMYIRFNKKLCYFYEHGNGIAFNNFDKMYEYGLVNDEGFVGALKIKYYEERIRNLEEQAKKNGNGYIEI